MGIEVFVQGEKDAELFAAVGPWLVDRAAWEALASSVAAAPGDVWHVLFQGGKPIGFAVSHRQENGLAHIRYVYAARGGQKSQEALVKASVQHARTSGCTGAYTYARKDDPVWSRVAFHIGEPRKGTKFCRFAITFEKADDKRRDGAGSNPGADSKPGDAATG